MKCRDLKALMRSCFKSCSPLANDIAAHILKFNPGDVDALKFFAEYYCLQFPQSAEANLAIQALYDAVKADEGNVKRWIDIGEIENYSGNYCNSEMAYKNALRLVPKSTDALIGISRLAEHPGSNVTNEDAFNYLKTALSLAPTNNEILYEIAICYIRVLDFENALETSNMILNLLGSFDTTARDHALTQHEMIIAKMPRPNQKP